MKILGWDDLFGPVTGKKNVKRNGSVDKPKTGTLTEDTMFDGICYAQGSTYKYFETENFGFVVFGQDSKTPDGNTPGRLIHRF